MYICYTLDFLFDGINAQVHVSIAVSTVSYIHDEKV